MVIFLHSTRPLKTDSGRRPRREGWDHVISVIVDIVHPYRDKIFRAMSFDDSESLDADLGPPPSPPTSPAAAAASQAKPTFSLTLPQPRAHTHGGVNTAGADLDKLLEMGFDRQASIQALSSTHGCLGTAAAILLSSCATGSDANGNSSRPADAASSSSSTGSVADPPPPPAARTCACSAPHDDNILHNVGGVPGLHIGLHQVPFHMDEKLWRDTCNASRWRW